MFSLGSHDDANGQMESAIAAWDRHVAPCRSCLRAGNALCSEGEYLSIEVIARQNAVGPEDSLAGRPSMAVTA